MAGMDMCAKPAPSTTSSSTSLTDADLKKVDPAIGMVTLKHGALANVDMPVITMTFKAKDAAMRQASSRRGQGKSPRGKH